MKKRAEIDAVVAERLISEFAENFKELTDGGPMPRYWRNKLLRALKPEPRRAGLKIKPTQYAAIVRDLAFAGESARERNKANNPATVRRQIAKRHGVSEKTVIRVQRDLPNQSFQDLVNMDPQRRSAWIDGLAQAAADWSKDGDWSKDKPDKI